MNVFNVISYNANFIKRETNTYATRKQYAVHRHHRSTSAPHPTPLGLNESTLNVREPYDKIELIRFGIPQLVGIISVSSLFFFSFFIHSHFFTVAWRSCIFLIFHTTLHHEMLSSTRGN